MEEEKVLLCVQAQSQFPKIKQDRQLDYRRITRQVHWFKQGME